MLRNNAYVFCHLAGRDDVAARRSEGNRASGGVKGERFDRSEDQGLEEGEVASERGSALQRRSSHQ